jgi:hypothetical protein
MACSIISDTKETGGKVTRVIISYIVVCFYREQKLPNKMLEKRCLKKGRSRNQPGIIGDCMGRGVF